MDKTFFKFVLGALGLALSASAIIYGIHAYELSNQLYSLITDVTQRRAVESESDEYGGTLPEETLNLFMDALKKDDLELASKYFLVESRTEWYDHLKSLREAGLLSGVIDDLSRAKKYQSVSKDQVFFTAANVNGEVVAIVDLVKLLKRWKLG